MHGHRFKVVVHVTANKLNKIGLAYDFSLLKQHLGEILSRFDHTCLNDVPPFDEQTMAQVKAALKMDY